MQAKLFLAALILCGFVYQPCLGQTMTKEQMLFLTPKWEGERFPDGRPHVDDSVIERMKSVSIEEAWGVLRNEGYHNQFEGDWQPIHEDVSVVGRALTVQYMPNRPDVADAIKEKGLSDGRIGNTNSWPIDMLQNGDVYVADGFGKIVDGTLIGDNLGNSIYAKSKNGVVFNASSRDLEGAITNRRFQCICQGVAPIFFDGSHVGRNQCADSNGSSDCPSWRCGTC